MGALIKLLACMTLIGYVLPQYNTKIPHERNCPTGWKFFDHKCYKRNPSNTDYNTARTQCLADGADMPIHDYAMENKMIQYWRENVDEWMGMEITPGETKHRWVDGKLVSETYTRWAGSEPNNGVGYNVAHLSSYIHYDAPKSCCRHVTCEMRASHFAAKNLCAHESVIRAMAEPLFKSIETDPSKSMTTCSQSCLQQHYSYSAITASTCVCMREAPPNGTCEDTSTDQQIFYEYTTNVTTKDFSMTITQPENQECLDPMHTYYDGSCYVYVRTNKRFFVHVREAKELYGPDAKIVSINNEAEARFIDEVIMSSYNRIGNNYHGEFFIGVLDARNVCDEGWTAYDGACFKFRDNGTKDTYENQRAYCQSLRPGADLLWFEDSYEQSYAMDMFMPADHRSRSIILWLGIYETTGTTSKQWKYPMWHDNSGHISWYSGEGNGNGERCARIASNLDYKAYDVQCTSQYEAICRYNPSERNSAGHIGYVNTDLQPLNESYHRWWPNHGYNSIPYCVYMHSYKMWFHSNCQDSRHALYEYPAKSSNFTKRPNGAVDAYTPIEARLTHDGGPLAENSVDFGYDGQFDWDSSYSTYTHFTRDLGKQEVVYDSTDFWYQRANGSATYEVVLPLEGSYVSCPTLVDTTNEMECEVAATGQASQGTLDFGDGSNTVQVNLEDSFLTVVGPNLRKMSYTGGQNTNGYALVMHNSRFAEHGMIQAFEYDAVTKGKFQFVVWRPRCSSSQVFCSKSMKCETTDYKRDVCETVSNWHKVNCGGNKWSLTERACVNSNGVRIAPTTRYYNNMPFSQFDKVGEYFTDTERLGRRFARLKREEMIEVRPGDFLGYIGWTGKLANSYMGTAWTAYASKGTSEFWPEHGHGHHNYEFFMNARVSTYKPYKVPYRYSGVDGKNVSFTATNAYAASEAVAQTTLTVYELVTGLKILTGEAVIKNVISTFTVNDHKGHPVTYNWNFADGNTLVETTGSVNHSFANSGRYNVTVRATNELSEDVAWTAVLVQAEITTGVYSQFDNSTKLGMKSVFKICIDDGNEVTYSISVGDGSVNPGSQVFDVNPSVCSSGWYDRNSLKCYLRSGSTTYDNANATCKAMYSRAYPAYYASQSEYQQAYAIYGGDNYFSGYHRVDGEWFDTFGLPVAPMPPFSSWYDGQGSDANIDCVTHYHTDSRWHQRNCHDAHHMMCMYEGRCETFSLGIDKIGTYDVKLKAENAVSMVEHSFVQYIQNPIEGLEIDPVPSQKWGEDVVLNVKWTSGNMLTAVCHNSDDDSGAKCADFEFNEGTNGLAGTGTIRTKKTEYLKINEHKRFVRFTNKISSMTATQTFTVMYEIKNLALAGTHNCAITKEDNVKFTLTALQMSHAAVSYSYNDQTVALTDKVEEIAEMTSSNNYPTHASTAKYSHEVRHYYPVEGTYTLTFNASNDISQATISRSIVIENPIRGYRMERTSPVALWPDQVARVNVTLIFEPTHDPIGNGNDPHLVPTAVTQYYRYGHPDCSLVIDTDECAAANGGCEQICVNEPGSYYCSCNTSYALHIDRKTCIYINPTTTGRLVYNDTNATTTTTVLSTSTTVASTSTTGWASTTSWGTTVQVNQLMYNVSGEDNTTTPAAPITTTAKPPTTPEIRLTTPDMWLRWGQSCPEATHNETVLVSETLTDDDYFNYTHYGTFEITTTFVNCISDKSFTFTVDIDEPAINLTIVSDEYILAWTTNSTLSIEMDWGSRINLTYNFNDTNNDTLAVYDRLYPNSAGHVWDVEGTFYPTITAVNRIGTWSAVTGPVYVQYILAEALRVETTYIWSIPYPSYRKEVFFDVYLKSEYANMMPTNVTANATFGDLVPGTSTIATLLNQYLPDVAQFDVSKNQNQSGDKHVWTYSHYYTVGDMYNVTIDFQNWVSSLSVGVEFHAIEEISPLTHYVRNIDNEVPIEEDSVDWTSPLHEFADCESVIQQATAKGKQLNCFFALRFLAGMWNSNSTGNLTDEDYTDSYKPMPTNDSIMPPIDNVTFANFLTNGTTLSKEELDVLYTNSRNIKASLTVDKHAAFDNLLRELKRNPPITVASFEAVRRKGIEIDKLQLADWMVRQEYSHNKTFIIANLRPGHIYDDGKGKRDPRYSYSIEEALTIYMEHERGTHLHFFWEWGDGVTEFTKLPMANHRYPKPGVYTYKVTAFNAVSDRSVSGSINIQRSVANLTIEGLQQVTRNTSNHWTVDLGSIGTDTCYLIDFKDLGTKLYPVGNRYYFLGNKDVCLDNFKIEMAVFPQHTSWFTNEYLEEEVEHKGSYKKLLTFLFGTLGTFRVTFKGINRVSTMTEQLAVVVTKGPCFKPLVLLNSQNPCEPNCKGTEKAFYKAQPIEVFSAVGYNCTTTKFGNHVWKIYQIDQDGKETEKFPENLTLKSDFHEIPLRQINMKERSLDYGRYKLTLNVTMYDEEIWTLDTMYLHVVKSPLSVSLNAPISKMYDRYKYEENYTLDAFKFSFDPDDPNDRTGWTFIWKCRRSCETFPEYGPDYKTILRSWTTQCNEQNKTYAIVKETMGITDVPDGGCFIEDGYHTAGLFTNSTAGKQRADLSYGYEFDLIEFDVDIFKDVRKAQLRMYLEITEGMPPDIDPKLCVSNCKAKVNYESIFSMTCNVRRSRGSYSYYWAMYRSPVNDFTDPLTIEIPRNEWEKNLPTDGSKTTMVETGNTQKSFALEPGFFTKLDTTDYFFVSVRAWRGSNIKNFGIALSGFQVNEPPTPGNCTAFPLNGTAVETKFNVKCTEFYDQHKPVRYQIGSRTKGTTNILWGRLRTTATDPTGGVVLGQGYKDYDYEVELFVRAEDSIGGKTVSEPMTITVSPAVINFAEVDMNDLASGDPAQAATMITAMTGGINEVTKETADEHVDLASMTKEERAEHDKREEEKRLAKEAEMKVFREKLAAALGSLPLDTLDAVSSVNQAAGSVAGKPSQMSENAIGSLATVGENSINVLNHHSETLDAGSMNEKVTETLTSQNGAGEAIAYMQAQEAKNPVLAEAKRKKREVGQPTTDDLAMSIQKSYGDLGSLVGGLKVAGEGDTVINTEKMKMAIMKQFAAAFAGGKMASGGDVNNGIALPSADALLGTGNDTAESVSSTTNNFNSLPFSPASTGEQEGNSTSTLPSGQILQIVLQDENGNPLKNGTNGTSSEPAAVSHIFMSRENVPNPIVSTNTAAKLGESMIAHKIMLPKQSSIHIRMRRTYPVANVSTAENDTSSTSTTTSSWVSTTTSNIDPFLANITANRTYSIFDDLRLTFVVYFRKGVKPTYKTYDFNCTLPVTFYNVDENTTVALGGAQSKVSCDDILAENPNATCMTHSLNRPVYPPHKEIVDTDDSVCFIPDSWLGGSDSDIKLYIGVSYYYMNTTNITGLTNVTWDEFSRGYMPPLEPVAIPPALEAEILYEMEVSTSSCKYWSPFYEDYVTEGCEVGPLSQVNVTHCMCALLSPPVPEYNEEDTTVTPEAYVRKTTLAKKTPGICFGSGISIPINTIDLSNSAFNNLGENPLIFTLMVSIMAFYLCCCIWATAQDRKDAIKAGVSPLLDNDPRDRYLYEVTVYTGSRSRASTTAKVSMVFSGEEDETQPRLVFDDKRPVLQSGGVDSFVMATPRGLGSLSHVRVWHDNSGKSPSWFFSRMQVVDMQTLEKYFFILDRWLAVSEDDGIIDRIIPLAGKDELTGFSHLFFTKAKKDLMDGHIWFSVFGKPHKSNFTRVQRLTCCLALLFASMTGNIFLYRSPTEEQAGTAIKIGPISLTLEQILTGILSSIIAFPINILIVLIFKNAKEPPYDLGKRCCAPCKKSKRKSDTNRFAADELAHQAKMLDSGAAQSRATSFASLNGVEGDGQAINEYLTEEVKKRNQKFKLPWGFVFVAYFLALAVTGVSFWYTVEVGGTFGPKKSAEWTAAFCTSIVESIFMSQPIKVLGIALFYALVIKKPTSDEDVDPGLEKGQEYLHKHEKQCQKLDQQVRKKLNKFKNIPIPPTEEYLSAARALRQKELKMMDVLKEVVMYVIFLYLLFMVSYGNRDPAAHSLYNALYDEFHQAAYVPDDGIEFSSVTEYKSFWNYCNNTLLPSLWPEPWYDGIVREPGFTADRNMYRVGVPRLRQLRMPSKQCAMPMYKYTKECNLDYDIFEEDTGNYYPGWIPVTNTSASDYNGPYPGWQYQSSAELDGFPFQGMAATYGGGGFNIELGHSLAKAEANLNLMKDNGWLTAETRAVLIEFVLYNSNMNLFAVSSMTFEFLSSGSVVPVYKMNLIRLDRYIGSYMVTVLVAEILTFLFVFFFIYKEVKAVKALKKKYFKSFWNIVELITLLLCVLALAMFFCRFAFIQSTTAEFQANPRSFVSFEFVTAWEEIYGYILAFIIFFANVKFLKLLRFNKKMSMLGMTMMYIGKPLLSFLLALSIVFIAFAQMAYLVYCRLLYSFSTFISASETLFTLMLNKFDYKELESANATFAPIIFFSFTILVSFVFLSFMVTIILDGFAEVTEELRHKENEYEIVSFIVSKFKGAVGLGSGPALPPMNKEPACMINETHAELMDRFDDFEEMFRDFCNDETKGDEPLVAKYEKQILAAKRTAKNRTIYATS